MTQKDREINQGMVNMRACTRNIEMENQNTVYAFLKITKRIINDYPEDTKSLREEYDMNLKLYKEKFGKLEEELLI